MATVAGAYHQHGVEILMLLIMALRCDPCKYIIGRASSWKMAPLLTLVSPLSKPFRKADANWTHFNFTLKSNYTMSILYRLDFKNYNKFQLLFKELLKCTEAYIHYHNLPTSFFYIFHRFWSHGFPTCSVR